jgi:hypothetical protein
MDQRAFFVLCGFLTAAIFDDQRWVGTKKKMINIKVFFFVTASPRL